jgi:crossover junction endodeoxyribonuclease RuvC
MRILGIDPGLRNTGLGVIEVYQNKLCYVMSGVIKTQSDKPLAVRLKMIFDGILEIIHQANPTVVSIEKVFVNNNPNSTLLLGQARGAAIAGCVTFNLEMFEYTALQIKQSVVGYGHADKIQIAKMVRYLLNLDGDPHKDAADALAVALAHTHYTKLCTIFNMHDVKRGRLIK